MTSHSIQKRPNGKWRARYRDPSGHERARHFNRKQDAQRFLDEIGASMIQGRYVDPSAAKMTFREWSERWLDGYGTRRQSTRRQARVHLAKINEEFGDVPVSAIRPSAVRSWTSRLKSEGLSASYVYALHARLSQVLSDAVHDGLLARNPCSRRTSPGAGSPRPYVATTEQVWALYDAMPTRLRPAILLGAFAGLRTAEACGLRVTDVDFMRGQVHPQVQYPAESLKTDASRSAVPIPEALTLELARCVAPGQQWLLTSGSGGQVAPWTLERAVRRARQEVEGLPDGFRFHDLRHYFASLLIASGADVKVVQARLRHASAKTTLDTYGHLWPDADESTRAAVGVVLAARADSLRTGGEAR